jgi:hypothetical protein
VAFSFRPYRRWSSEWDHDHCEGCTAGFSEDHPADLHEGWATTPEYELGAEYSWVCDECFERFRDELDWRVVTDDRPVRPRGLFDEGDATATEKEPRLHDE